MASDRTYCARRVWRDLLAMRRTVACTKSNGRGVCKVCGRGRDAGACRRTMAIGSSRPCRRTSLTASLPPSSRTRSGSRTLRISGQPRAGTTSLIELFSRRVVGWSMSAAMTAQLVTDALLMTGAALYKDRNRCRD